MSCPDMAYPSTWYNPAVRILQGLGIAPTSVNINLLVAWMAREHGVPGSPWNCFDAANRYAYNPLDTALGAAGSVAINPAGVQAYPTAAVGITANVRTFQPAYNRFATDYAPIVAALRASDPNAFLAQTAAFAVYGGFSTRAAAQYLAGVRILYQALPAVPDRALPHTPPKVPPVLAKSPWVLIATVAVLGGIGLGVLYRKPLDLAIQRGTRELRAEARRL